MKNTIENCKIEIRKHIRKLQCVNAEYPCRAIIRKQFPDFDPCFQNGTLSPSQVRVGPRGEPEVRHGPQSSSSTKISPLSKVQPGNKVFQLQPPFTITILKSHGNGWSIKCITLCLQSVFL